MEDNHEMLTYHKLEPKPIPKQVSNIMTYALEWANKGRFWSRDPVKRKELKIRLLRDCRRYKISWSEFDRDWETITQ